MMNKHIFPLSSAVLALISLTGLTACSDSMDLASDEAASEMKLKIKGFSGSAQETLHIYQFDYDRLIQHSALRQYDAAAINLQKGNTRSLYCVAGIEMRDASDLSDSEFSRSIVTLEEGSSLAPVFFSGCAEIGDGQRGCELTMRRGVARIDLDARDAEMEISEIVVDDVPTASYVFPASGWELDAPTVTFSHTFDFAPEKLEEGILTLFESDKELHVTVKGKAMGADVEIPAVLPSVERGKVYTLRVYDRNVTLSAAFSVSDWEEGDTIYGAPDTSSALLLDQTASVIPSGVKVDFMRNIIEVPAEGVKGMSLAFSSDLRVELDTVILSGDRVEKDSVGRKYVRVSRHAPVTTPKGIVTSFGIDIDEQLKARPGYEIRLELRKPNLSVSCDNVTIRVAQSPYQIQTVRMAGSDWMAFNATTPDIGEQIFPLPGKSVEETYREAWVSTLGNFFQYGRQKGYSPWEKNDPNGNEETPRDIPWTTLDCVPVPEGYHVANAAEWVALLPVGTKIPSTYTAGNKETIKVEIVEYPGVISDSPCEAANTANLRKRCLRFESMDTGNVLIFPICGLKSNSWDLYPGYGKNKIHDFAGYWIAEDRYLWYFTVAEENGVLTSAQGQNRWNYNGFVPTRGVKND